MESKQMTLMNLFSGQQWRNRPADMGGGWDGEGERYGQSNTEIYRTVCKIANGNLLCDSGNSNRGSVTG